jgi:predicted nucleic acid-binding protein
MTLKNPPEAKVVITDTSCLILLDKIGALPILRQVFSTVFTTTEIAKEFGLPLPEWIIVKNADTVLKNKFNNYVDEGEASAIALATTIDCDYLIVDDLAARKLATSLGIPIKGTTGVLLLAKQSGVIPLFRPYLNLIQKTNFRLSTRLAEQFIRDAGE